MPIVRKKVFLSGLLGGLVVGVMTSMASARGADLPMLFGTMLGLSPSTAAWMLGMTAVMLVGGLVSVLLYAPIFRLVNVHSTITLGIGLGAIHGVVAGLLLALTPAVHPLVPETIAAPGLYLATFDAAGVFTFLFSHLVYGAIVGAAYQFAIPVEKLGDLPEQERKQQPLRQSA